MILISLLIPNVEKATATHSSTLAWKIPWTEEAGGLQSLGSRRVGHDWATSLSLVTFMHWRRKWHPLQCSCLENPRGGGAWWASVYSVAQSQTRLKQLSSSSVPNDNGDYQVLSKAPKSCQLVVMTSVWGCYPCFMTLRARLRERF